MNIFLLSSLDVENSNPLLNFSTSNSNFFIILNLQCEFRYNDR